MKYNGYEVISYGYDSKRKINGYSGWYISYKKGTRIVSINFKSEKQYQDYIK